MTVQQSVKETSTGAATKGSTSTSPAPVASQKSIDTVNTGIQTYRIFRGLHRLHRGVQNVAGAFVPDIDDFQEGDESLSDDDNDFENSTSSDTDDTDGDNNDNSVSRSDELSGKAGDHSDYAEPGQTAIPEHQLSFGTSAALPATRSSGISKTYTVPATSPVKKITPLSTSDGEQSKIDISSTAANAKPAAITSKHSESALAKSEHLEKGTTEPTHPSTQQPISSVVEKSASEATNKDAEGAPPAIQYKIVKVKKPDGTIVKVKRTIKPTETTSTPTIGAMPVAETPAEKAPNPSITVPVTKVNPQVRERHTDTSKETTKVPEIHEKQTNDESTSEDAKYGGKPVRHLERRTSPLSQIIIWAIMIIIPLLFILLGVLAAVSNGRPVDSSLGSGVLQAIKVSVSVWPIVFAAIFAQSLKMLASYKVERGLRLMTLEQLITSHSVASAIKQPFFLQTINWTSIILIALWSLSPLAGQAILRMLTTASSNASAPVVVGYLESVPHNNIVFIEVSDPNIYYAEISAIYSASLLDSFDERQSAQDLWNNPRIPALAELKGNMDANGWLSVSNTPGYNYSSLLGIPLAGVPTNGTTTFTISSYYLVLDCSFLNSTAMDVINSTGSNLSKSPSQTLYMSLNPENGDHPEVGDDSENGNDLPAKLTFASQIIPQGGSSQVNPPTTSYAYSVCTLNKTAVDSHITCLAGNEQCTVDMMRQTPNPIDNNPVGLGPNFVTLFLEATSPPESGTMATISTLTERFILNPNATTVDQNYNNQNFDISSLPLNVFQERLALVINSFWMTGFSPMYQSTKLPVNATLAAVATTNATWIDTSIVYSTSWGWLTVLLVSSAILLVAGVAGAIWDAQTIGPDILGFASSIVRSSKFVKLKDIPSTTSGPERARMLGNIRVMLQDVKPGAAVGKIALGTVSEKTERLRRDRVYG